MTHIPDCGFWNPDCGRCRTMIVGDLDDNHFSELIGCTRQEFETWCQEAPRVEYPNTLDQTIQKVIRGPKFLYNFWYAIMEANALSIYQRKLEIEQRQPS